MKPDDTQNPALAARIFEEFHAGAIVSPDLKKIFGSSNEMREHEKAFREEITFALLDLCGQNRKKLSQVTGMKVSAINYLVQRKNRALKQAGMEKHRIKHEIDLENIRYKGRKDQIKVYQHGIAIFQAKAIAEAENMTGKEAVTAAAIWTDKMLLLSGQPTSRISKMDERMMGDAELAKKSKALDEKLLKLQITPKPDEEAA
jgi:hypothetical protein